jgi:enamine deaminase RidA (YjgF/YER057c/UK114 family)
MKILQPPGWPRPRGYSNGIAARGTQIYVAGMVGWNADEKFESDDFAAQFRQALDNIRLVLAEAGAAPHHIVRLTMYFVDKSEYSASLDAVGAAYRDIIGRHYPVMAAVEVKGLMAGGARLEIEATAVIPDD